MKAKPNNKKILIITDHFPPAKDGRSEKMGWKAHYLTKMGWQVMVITPKLTPSNLTATNVFGKMDLSAVDIVQTDFMFSSILPDLNNRASKTVDRRRILRRLAVAFPLFFGFWRWIPYAVYWGCKMARSSGNFVVYSISNPVSLHFVALLVTYFTKVKWVAEFRDSWAAHPERKRGPAWLNKWLEGIIVKYANRIIWHKGMRHTIDYFLSSYPQKNTAHFCELGPIGYVEDEFYQSNPKQHSDMLRISYVGRFYGQEVCPDLFLQALSEFCQRYPERNLRVDFYGDWSKDYEVMVKKFGLQEKVFYGGFLDRKGCLDVYANSDALLLIIGESQGQDLAIPTKVWDYLGAGKAILGIIPKGATYDLLSAGSSYYLTNDPTKEEILLRLNDLWSGWRHNGLYMEQSTGSQNDFSREFAEKQFAEVLETVSKST